MEKFKICKKFGRKLYNYTKIKILKKYFFDNKLLYI